MSNLTAPRTTHRLQAVTTVPRRRHLHVTTRGRLLVLVGLVLLILGAFAVGRSASGQATDVTRRQVPLTQATVQQGDTLWSLARGLAPARDPREVVAQIRRLNHLQSASLQVGQQLLLPGAA